MTPTEKFFALAKKHVLYPPVHNVSALAFGPAGTAPLKTFFNSAQDLPALCVLSKDYAVAYFFEDEFKDIAKELFTRYWKGDVQEEEIIGILTKNSKLIESLYDKLTYEYIRFGDYKEILNSLAEMNNLARELNAKERATIIFDKEFCQQLIQELNISIKPDMLNNLWKDAIAPAFRSFEKRRERYLLELIINNTPWDKISENCQYFFANYDRTNGLDFVKKELYKKYEKISSAQAKNLLKKEEKEHELMDKKFSDLLSKLSYDEKRLVKYIQFIMRLRDERKDEVSKSLTISFRIAQRIFAEIGLNEELTNYVSTYEILHGPSYFKKEKGRIMKRQNGFAVLVFNDGSEEQEYTPVEKIVNEIEDLYAQQHSYAGNVRGQVGCKGIAKGYVRIIRNPKNAIFKEGEVLVTGMTRPEFVPIMKKAAAIVTDEGGITCHAAIVSRELKIPCIIGTKVATKVLKNGDFVEVNANEGIVKKLPL